MPYPELLFYALIGLAVAYRYFVAWLTTNWDKIGTKKTSDITFTQPVKITVIIPARNEADNLPDLIRDLENQTYPVGCFEVIIVNDCSTDNTSEVVGALADQSKINIRLLEAKHPEGTIAFKKSGIAQAIAISAYPYILCTDADCRVGSNWIQSMAESLKQGMAMVSGPVMLQAGDNFFDTLQQVEFATLIGSGAALLQGGLPSMCNGANLAYAKSAFQEVGGFAGNEHLASGDDEFLLHKIASRYPEQVCFCKIADAVVTTKPLPNITSFTSQRRRWASKWSNYQKIGTKLLSVGVFAFHLLWIVLLTLNFGSNRALWQIALVMFAKAWSEWLFIGKIYASLKIDLKRKQTLAFVLLQVIYSPYVVFFGIAGGLVKGFEWKGRKG